MKDKARIENKMTKIDIKLFTIKQQAKDYVCNKMRDMFPSFSLDSEAFVNYEDVESLRDDCDVLLKTCKHIDKCKDILSLGRLWKLHALDQDIFNEITKG